MVVILCAQRGGQAEAGSCDPVCGEDAWMNRRGHEAMTGCKCEATEQCRCKEAAERKAGQPIPVWPNCPCLPLWRCMTGA